MHGAGDERGVSPVVGVALLIAIVLVLSVASAYVFLGVADTNDPSPDVRVDLRPAEDPATYEIVHRGGEPLGGEDVVVEGVADPQTLADERLRASEGEEVVPTDDTVRIVYDDGDTTYVLAEFDVDGRTFSPDIGCEDVESAVSSGQVTIDNETIACDITTEVDANASDVDVDVFDNGTVVGTLDGEVQNVDIYNNGSVIGDVNASGDVDVDAGTVEGDVRSSGNDVVFATGTEIEGSVVVDADTNVDADGTTIRGDVVIEAGGNGEVNDLSNTTITGDVYVDDDSDLVCGGGSQIDGEPCSSYDPKDPSTYGGSTPVPPRVLAARA